jgi:L-threonylcarbamoyladenylate synthase
MIIVPHEDPDSIARAVTILKAGGVIVYPTDTAYGLGADATNADAIEKIFRIKERSDGKPLPVIVGNLEHAQGCVEFSADAEKLARAYWPGALTLILRTSDTVLADNVRGAGTVGVRVPGNEWCCRLATALGRPITSTSANTTGTPAEYSIKDVRKNLGARGELVDLWIDGGALPGGPVSTVASLCNGFEVLREGAISREDIEKVLQ